MEDVSIRAYRAGDEQALSALICRNLYQINSKDYAPEEIHALAARHQPDDIRRKAGQMRVFVALLNGKPAGCLGAAALHGGYLEFQMVFVDPSLHAGGIGSALIAHGERYAAGIGANCIVLRASLTAHRFYARLGYRYQADKPDSSGLYPMEKRLAPL